MLRTLTPADFPDLAQILQDPAVVYAYEHDFTDADVGEWLERQRMRYRRHGFGLWAVQLKETGEMIGQAGLTMQPYKEKEVPEVGYLLKKKHWHCGYAAEAAAGCRDYAFYKLDMAEVFSIIKADNAPSVRVAERIGMTRKDAFITRYYHGDMLHYLYSVRRE